MHRQTLKCLESGRLRVEEIEDERGVYWVEELDLECLERRDDAVDAIEIVAVQVEMLELSALRQEVIGFSIAKTQLCLIDVAGEKRRREG